MDYILAFDVGTTQFKAGVFTPDLDQVALAARAYSANLYDHVKADIDPEKWWHALVDTCSELRELLPSVKVISFAVTTPGLVPMAEDGSALGPGILFLDGRSHEQAKRIRDMVGEDLFMQETCNLPVSGGSSLCSILWLRDNQPNVWDAASKFGHCNTYLVKRLTGKWAIDPSTTSITGMYNTARNDLTWNEQVLSCAGIPVEKLPPLVHSHAKVGNVLPSLADAMGMRKDAVVLCGGNDAVLGALSSGLINPGDAGTIHGTCDVTQVCVDQPIGSRNYNLRCHVIPDRWLTFFVLNTGGKALEWFWSTFCSELSESDYFGKYVPEVLDRFLCGEAADVEEEDLPQYEPYLQGSRYSLEQLTASFSNLSLRTTRDSLLLSLIRGNLTYSGAHLKEVQERVRLSGRMSTSGGAAKIGGFIRAKRRWMGDYDYEFRDQSSLRGAALLGNMYMTGGSA
jgi:xylulokinase